MNKSNMGSRKTLFDSIPLSIQVLSVPLPAARALCCICLRQDAAAIANGIGLRAIEPRLSQENGKKCSEGCARFLLRGAEETRYSLVRPFGFRHL